MAKRGRPAKKLSVGEPSKAVKGKRGRPAKNVTPAKKVVVPVAKRSVAKKAKEGGRRRFTDAEKIAILKKLDVLKKTGGAGEFLKEQGLYFPTMSLWRKQFNMPGTRGRSPGVSPKAGKVKAAVKTAKIVKVIAKKEKGIKDAKPTLGGERRKLTPEYKMDVLKQIDALKKQGKGAVGAFLEKENLYFSTISMWRNLLKQNKLSGSARGRKPKALVVVAAKSTQLAKESSSLQKKLDESNALVTVQKKFYQSALKGKKLELTPERVALIDKAAVVCGVDAVCDVLGVARATYYRLKKGK
jgi:hypothetical protein